MHERNHAAARKAYSLPRDTREHRDVARTARHGQRSDPRLLGRRDGEPGGESEPAVGEYLGSDELYGFRLDGGCAVPRDALVVANEDRAVDRPSGSGVDQVPDGAHQSPTDAPKPPRARESSKRITPCTRITRCTTATRAVPSSRPGCCSYR